MKWFVEPEQHPYRGRQRRCSPLPAGVHNCCSLHLLILVFLQEHSTL